MGNFGIGQSVSRFEGPWVPPGGQGRYLADVVLPRQAYAVVVRSPHAHARLRSIDPAAAERAPGVLGVLTGADLARDGLGTTATTLSRGRPDGSPMFAPAHPGLARDRVRYVGDPIALVVADSLPRAQDAAELVAIDYEPLLSVTATADAAGPGTPGPSGTSARTTSRTSSRSATPRRPTPPSRRARHVVRRRYVITRVHAQYLEPRGAMGDYDPGEERYTLYADVQYPHRVRGVLAKILGVPEPRVRVIAGDIGGGFGAKGWQYVEHRLVLWAARRLGRPVRAGVRADRDPPGRRARARQRQRGRAGVLDGDGRFLALRVRTTANIGAYLSSDRNLLPTFQNVGTVIGVYAHPGGPRPRARRADEHQPDRAVPRRRAPRGDLRHRAAHRRRRPRVRRNPIELRRRTGAPRRHAVQDRAGPSPTTAASSRS